VCSSWAGAPASAERRFALPAGPLHAHSSVRERQCVCDWMPIARGSRPRAPGCHRPVASATNDAIASVKSLRLVSHA
jgi:hypothetical protein